MKKRVGIIGGVSGIGSLLSGEYLKSATEVVNEILDNPATAKELGFITDKKHKRCSYRRVESKENGMVKIAWVCSCGKELK